MLVVLGATVVLFVYLTIITPKGFFPQQDTGQMIGGLQSDQSSSFTLSRQRLSQLVHILGRDPAVATEVAFGGNNAAGGFMFVTLKPKNQRPPIEQVIARLRPKLARVIGVSLFLNPVGDVQVGGRQSNATYHFTLQAENLTDLRTWAARLAERMKTKPQLIDVNTDQEDHGLESFITIDLGQGGSPASDQQADRQHPLRRLWPTAGVDDLQGDQPVQGRHGGRPAVLPGPDRPGRRLRQQRRGVRHR